MTEAVTIWHNPACGTSRNTLAMIRAAGIEPTVVEYLKAPTTREGAGEGYRGRQPDAARGRPGEGNALR